MRRPRLVVGSILMTLALLAPGTEAAKKLRVVATIPDLKSLTEAVGGDLVEVDALTRGTHPSSHRTSWTGSPASRPTTARCSRATGGPSSRGSTGRWRAGTRSWSPSVAPR